MSQDDGKKACGYRAADMIENSMKVGIGTGSTVFFFIERLLQRCNEGLKIEAAFSSNRSQELATHPNIHHIDSFTNLDITVDGADEIDPKHNMIKGGGGALFREKVLASSSTKMCVIVDETKCVQALGKFKLPVEISSFAHDATITKIKMPGEIRTQDGKPYLTDNNNYIYDIHLSEPLTDPKPLHAKLIDTIGVLETGLFFNLPTTLIVGKSDGTIDEK